MSHRFLLEEFQFYDSTIKSPHQAASHFLKLLFQFYDSTIKSDTPADARRALVVSILRQYD